MHTLAACGPMSNHAGCSPSCRRLKCFEGSRTPLLLMSSPLAW